MDNDYHKIYAAALKNGKTIWDRTNNIVYIPDINDESEMFGIQMFYYQENQIGRAIIEKNGITQFCLSCIPAPGSICGNEHGYSSFFPFCDDDTYSTDESIKDFVSDYMEIDSGILYEIH